MWLLPCVHELLLEERLPAERQTTTVHSVKLLNHTANKILPAAGCVTEDIFWGE